MSKSEWRITIAITKEMKTKYKRYKDEGKIQRRYFSCEPPSPSTANSNILRANTTASPHRYLDFPSKKIIQ